MLTSPQAIGLFSVLVDELAVDPAVEGPFLDACAKGAERIRFSGFSDRPKRERPRLTLWASDPTHLRCPPCDQAKLKRADCLRIVGVSAFIADVLSQAPEAAAVGTRTRVSVLAA